MSAVPVWSFLPAEADVQHPWVLAARICAAPRAGGLEEVLVRIVPSDVGLDALRAKGKRDFVADLCTAYPRLPAEPRAWRLVEDLDDYSGDESDRLNKPRVRSNCVISEDVLETRLFVPYDLRVFEGHFNAVPLLPGMLQVAWALELAQGHLSRVGRFRGITSVKFRRLVRPGMDLRLALRWAPSTCELQFEYSQGEQTTSCGRLRMTGAGV